MSSHTEKKSRVAKFVHNGLPDGYVVRLASGDLKHFPTATRVEEMRDGSIEVWFDRIYLGRLAKQEFVNYWKVFKERTRVKRKP